MKIIFAGAPLFVKGAIKKVYETAFTYLGQPAEAEASVSFVNETIIRQLNAEYRSVDKVTDVLSFPTIDNPSCKILCTKDCDVNIETGNIELGDVIICTLTAKRQAREYGHSFRREVCFLALHGLLHLLGYDHMNETDEKRMTDIQKAVMEKVKIARG